MRLRQETHCIDTYDPSIRCSCFCSRGWTPILDVLVCLAPHMIRYHTIQTKTIYTHIHIMLSLAPFMTSSALRLWKIVQVFHDFLCPFVSLSAYVSMRCVSWRTRIVQIRLIASFFILFFHQTILGATDGDTFGKH